MKLEFKQIGIIHSPFKAKEEAPIQPFKSDAIGEVEVFKDFEKGLEGIEQFSHIILVYHFHRIKDERLKVKPYLVDDIYGVYATRHPHRPNHIGISTVKLLKRKGNIIHVKNIDIVDGSPLLDIKPYVSAFDRRDNVKDGWLGGEI
jgi:tRNA-Thr(GGU) m(6)t(6)A37 methyltransferase TsaA